MAQESRLAVTIDSRGAKRNADDLSGSLERMEKAGDSAAASAEGVTSSLDDQRKELAQLLGQINPTVGALGRLDDMQEKLAKYKKAGIVESDTFVEYTQRINTMRDSLGESSTAMNKAGMSARAYQAALRGVPAQFTDIAVSLQAGQSPMQVLLQQGGQLKDMFGGIGPATRALGGYVLGLVNPFTVAAAAAATLGLVFYDVEKQIAAFNKALFSGSADSGQTVEGMAKIAMSVAEITGDFSEAKDAVLALGASGRASEIQFRNLAQASASVAKFTGQSATDVAKSFGSLGDSATKAAQKVSEQYGLITSAQYEVIVGLEDQGRKQEALDTLSENLNTNAQKRLQRYRDSLSELERDWDDVGTAISNAYSKIKAELFPGDNKQIEIAQRILDTRKEGGFTGALSNLFSFGDNTNQALRSQIKTLSERREAAASAAKAESAETDANQGRITAAARWASSQLEYLDKESKKRNEITEARELGLKAGRSEEEIAKRIAAIESKYADKSKPKTHREDNRGVAEAENTFARLYNQYDPAAQAARALTKEQTQLDLALSKGKISQEEYGKALAQASLNYAAAIKGAQGLTQAEQYRAQVNRRLAIEEEGYRVEANSVGMGDLQADRYRQRVELERQMNDEIIALQDNLRLAENASQRAAIQEQIKILEETNPARLAAMQAGWAQMDQAMLNPINGWTAAVQNFGNEARDIAGQTQSIFSSSFNTIANDITSAIKSGSLSLKTLGDIGADVIDQVITGFIRMGVQMAMNAALNATLGASAAATNIALAGTTASAWAPAAAMASLATLGTNAVPAATALTSTTALAAGLAVVPGFATGGYVSGAGTGTSDSITARLSDGEFVVNAQATKRNRSLLEAINSNERVSLASQGSSVAVAQQGSQGGTQATQVIHQVTIENYSQSQIETRTDSDGRLRVIVQAAVDEISGQLASGYGQVVDAGEGAYGWKRQGS